MKYMWIIGGILFVIIVFWIIAFLVANDFSVPSVSLSKFKNILVIYPHPDDEVLTTGGLINTFSKSGKKVNLIILTKGERGTPDGSVNNDLIKIRTEEAKKVSHILGATLHQNDFGDGEIAKNRDKVTEYLDSQIEKIQPDLVVTYDLSGLYGHEDHMVCSEIVTDLVKNRYKHTTLWYAIYPKRVLSMISLPEHMAKDEKFKSLRSIPNLKVFVGAGVFSKIQSVYAYKSQFESFRNGLPFKFIPPWFFYTIQFYEYYYQI